MKDQVEPRSAEAAVAQARNLRRRLTWTWSLTNALGALLVFVFVAFLLPISVSNEDSSRLRLISALVGSVYFPLTLLIARWWAFRVARPTWEWFEAGRAPDSEERDRALRVPLQTTKIAGTFWAIGALVFGLIQLGSSFKLAAEVCDSILLGGVTTCALGYLLAERIWRPVVARSLEGDPPRSVLAPGVRARLTMAWALATGVPLMGIFGVASAGLLGGHIGKLALASTVFLALIALAAGLLATHLVAQSIADPVDSVRSALSRVERGELGINIPVDDGSEIGLLQAGFNRMAHGLRERERLREVFGRQVGRDVARAALDGGIELGGEEREVAVMFVDVVGSTALATEREPTAVVHLLNSFFAIVVAAVEENGGWVNKFEGDAALCIFGAPAKLDDHAGAALRAARILRQRLTEELPAVGAGIGVSAGRAVAGNVGTEERYEYTVIGDPVNEAARLCDLAKPRPEGLLASEAALDRASDTEATHWTLGEAVTLRGRSAATRVATPTKAAQPATVATTA